jgi:hypothetical protein
MPIEDQTALRNLMIIVARKADYVNGFVRSVDTQKGAKLSSREKKAFRETLLRAVAAMPYLLFVTNIEQSIRRLNPLAPLQDLNLEAIWNELRERITPS